MNSPERRTRKAPDTARRPFPVRGPDRRLRGARAATTSGTSDHNGAHWRPVSHGSRYAVNSNHMQANIRSASICRRHQQGPHPLGWTPPANAAASETSTAVGRGARGATGCRSERHAVMRHRVPVAAAGRRSRSSIGASGALSPPRVRRHPALRRFCDAMRQHAVSGLTRRSRMKAWRSCGHAGRSSRNRAMYSRPAAGPRGRPRRV